MKPFCRQRFDCCPDHGYPHGWKLEKNSANSNCLGEVRAGIFELLFPGNRHIAVTPELTDFECEMEVVTGKIFPCAGLRIFIGYQEERRTGYLLTCRWGTQIPHLCRRSFRGVPPEYFSAALSLYDGRKQGISATPLQEERGPSGIYSPDCPLKLGLKVKDGILRLHANGASAGVFPLPGYRGGMLGLDRNLRDFKDSLGILSFHLDLPEEAFSEEILLPERSMEFPPGVNGIVSPVHYHASVIRRCGIPVLKMRLTGGPPKESPYPEIERFRLGERMTSPYLRLIRADGSECGRYCFCRGTVGLDAECWNELCSVYPPSSHVFPVETEFILREWSDEMRFVAGYEKYEAEDSNSTAGGPTEAFLDAQWNVLCAGPAEDERAELLSVPDKKIVAGIPRDIPDFEKALAFARRNFFYAPDEEPRVVLRFLSRHAGDGVSSLRALLVLENAFGEPADWSAEVTLKRTAAPENAAGYAVFSGNGLLPKLPCGVWHLRGKVFFSGVRHEVRRALEILTNDLSLPPPQASGLPALHCNIIAGIPSEHFNPWSETVNDIMHYHSTGSLFFKVAQRLQAPRLLHVYGRPYLFWLRGCCFASGGIEENAGLVREADYTAIERYRPDCWCRAHYNSPDLRRTLIRFLKSGAFHALPGGCLSAATVPEDPQIPLSEAQFRELYECFFNEWLDWCDRESGAFVLDYADALKKAGAKGLYAFCSAGYPTYASVGKSDYFLRFCGLDPRNGPPVEQYAWGPNGVEDYPWSSRYPLSRGVFQMAAGKLSFPNAPQNPECFGTNGETADSHVVYAHPPFGRSSPPAGFLEKLFYNYSYGICYFRDGAFHYWNDHGYHIRMWEKHHYEDMFRAYRFIRRHSPVRPAVRSVGFVLSLDSCAAHRRDCDDIPEIAPGGGIYNTAEEFVPFIYEQRRKQGGSAGFVTRMEDLAGLRGEDVSLLVVPPLDGVPEKYQKELRRLHGEGTSLLGSESPGTLADLFGLNARSAPLEVRKILPCEALACPADLSEVPEQRALFAGWDAAAGATLLLRSETDAPVLSEFASGGPPCAFFHLPPSAVRRAREYFPSYGAESLSTLVNLAAGAVCRRLERSGVSLSEGSLLDFQDTAGEKHFIISEDHWPEGEKTVFPTLVFHMRGITREKIESSVPYETLWEKEDALAISFMLKAHESAIVSIRT